MKWRIMVVDDEPDVRQIIRTALEPAYEIVEARDGLDALEKLHRVQPDFVILDIMMPMMDGFETCRSIRKDPRMSRCPVMYLTALSSKEDIKKGYGTGANLYLTKPFDPQRLKKNIDVFFKTSPPPRTRKQYSIKELDEFETKGREPVAPGAVDMDLEPPSRTNVRRAAAAAPAASAASPAAGGSILRVMVIDDDPDVQELIEATLSGTAEVVRAMDGIHAIENLVQYQPDILILDIMMPKMSGFQLCQSLRANRAFSKIPILICSAKGADKDKTFASRVGANDYLVKPFQPQELIDKVLQLTHLPGFRIRPKNKSIGEIKGAESAERTDIFQMDSDARLIQAERMRAEQEARRRRDNPGPSADEGQEDDDNKKKRLFFGFGKK